MFELFDKLTLGTALGCMAVLSAFFFWTILYIWLYRRRATKVEEDRKKFTEEFNRALSHRGAAVSTEAFSDKHTKKYHNELLVHYIQKNCFGKNHPDLNRIREYANKTGLMKELRKRAAHGQSWKRAMAVRVLAALGDSSDIILFRDTLARSRFRPEIFAAAVGLINHGITESLGDILDKLYDPQKPNRDQILALIGYFGPIAAEPIIQYIRNRDVPPVLKATLIDFLGVQKARMARPLLEETLKQAPGSLISLHIIEALEKLGTRDSCGVILPYLKDPDFRVRLKAVNALERLAGSEYIASAEALLSDPDLFVQRNAAEAISRMGAPGISRLRELSNSDNKQISIVSKLILTEREYDKIRWRFRYGDSIP